MSDSYLASLEVADRAGLWSAALNARAYSLLVAEDETGIVGFTSVGPSRDEDAEPGDLEIYAIYCTPARGVPAWHAT